MKLNKRVTSFGWIWIDETGKQVAAQVGHEWNGEYLTQADRRILGKINRRTKTTP